MSDNHIPDALSARLRSPLHAFDLARQTRPPVTGDGILFSELPNLGYLILRGHASDADFTGAVASVLGQPLPVAPSTWVRTRVGVVFWVSPDEWWLVCARVQRDAVCAALQAATQGLFAQVVDNSGGHAAVRVSGARHLMLLRHLGPYDFESLEPGQAIGTVMGKANVTVLRTDSQGVVLLFRRSFADYFWRLLIRTASPYKPCVAPLSVHADPVISPMLAASQAGH
ncbi:sarcosine oxidase subunit gamma [uncultured Aquabacterium sp.]|uniref:sarcosine oxidase subunit gamma n=1 Tax=Aquabacterium sp. TaxID=1872578 RepID=UPI0025F1DFF0|nr:sarcosine oxidase subunit gamma family protein [uncultured Aquabacterium sp.]